MSSSISSIENKNTWSSIEARQTLTKEELKEAIPNQWQLQFKQLVSAILSYTPPSYSISLRYRINRVIEREELQTLIRDQLNIELCSDIYQTIFSHFPYKKSVVLDAQHGCFRYPLLFEKDRMAVLVDFKVIWVLNLNDPKKDPVILQSNHNHIGAIFKLSGNRIVSVVSGSYIRESNSVVHIWDLNQINQHPLIITADTNSRFRSSYELDANTVIFTHSWGDQISICDLSKKTCRQQLPMRLDPLLVKKVKQTFMQLSQSGSECLVRLSKGVSPHYMKQSVVWQKKYDKRVSNMILFNDGRFAVALEDDSRIYVYKNNGKQMFPILNRSTNRFIYHFLELKVGSHTYFACGSRDGYIYIWNLDNLHQEPIKLWEPSGNKELVSPANGWLATFGVQNYSIRLWNLKKREKASPPLDLKREIVKSKSKPKYQEITVLSQKILAVCAPDPSMQIWWLSI